MEGGGGEIGEIGGIGGIGESGRIGGIGESGIICVIRGHPLRQCVILQKKLTLPRLAG